VDGKEIKVFSNGMVDMSRFVDFDPAECGVNEKVRYLVLKQLMEQYEGEALKDAVRENIDVLIPKHIVLDDIYASVNYLDCLAHGMGEPTISTIWATAA
jgi:DNA-directed RNA polymerase subunit beta